MQFDAFLLFDLLRAQENELVLHTVSGRRSPYSWQLKRTISFGTRTRTKFPIDRERCFSIIPITSPSTIIFGRDIPAARVLIAFSRLFSYFSAFVFGFHCLSELGWPQNWTAHPEELVPNRQWDVVGWKSLRTKALSMRMTYLFLSLVIDSSARHWKLRSRFPFRHPHHSLL